MIIKKLRTIKLLGDNLNCCPFYVILSVVSCAFEDSYGSPALQVLWFVNSFISIYIARFNVPSLTLQLECGKGFRYKVSQRSHKCSGVLVKQPGELIQKLMQNSSILTSTITSSSMSVASETATNTNDSISISNQTLHESHDFCLDDLLKVDSYEKLMKNESQSIPPQLLDNAFDDNSSVMSYNNMTMNSNYGVASLGHNTNYNMTLETINEDSIKELLGALR